MTVFLHMTHLPGGATDYLVPDTAEGRSFARSTPLRRWYPLLSLGKPVVRALVAVFSCGGIVGFLTPLWYRAWFHDPVPGLPHWYWWGLNICGAIALSLTIGSILVRSAISWHQRRVDRLHPTVYRAPATNHGGELADLPRTIDGLETLEVLWEAGQVDDATFAAVLARLRQSARRGELDVRHEQWMQDKEQEAREARRRAHRVDGLIAKRRRGGR